ncbi:hypothetical protein V6N12_045158 [Hibiscus sabdariffa]|uniref:Uncharacterized protein n=1 Tax=Hibiscus sabdariffa TaxID=183260 RepID=A0ABR2G1Z0_9ROSI
MIRFKDLGLDRFGGRRRREATRRCCRHEREQIEAEEFIYGLIIGLQRKWFPVGVVGRSMKDGWQSKIEGRKRMIQPNKPVTKAQVVIAIATGETSDLVSEELARIEAELMFDPRLTAKAWGEDEVKRARERAKALEEAREHWQRHASKWSLTMTSVKRVLQEMQG